MADAHSADLPVAEAGAALRRGALTSEALTRAHLDRIAARDAAIGAFVHVAADAAMEAARDADRMLAEGQDPGPMCGIPFAVKDVIDVEGWPVRWGTRQQRDRRAGANAAAVQILRAAGAVPLGLVVTYEFATVGPDATSLYPQPVNPWNRDHVTGGSSSGSAAAVAAGMVRVALGTDTGGSVRSPASYCGVVGLKPTFGALPMGGVMPLSPSLDHLGIMARSVADAAATFAVLSGTPEPGTDGIAGTTLAYGRTWAEGDAADPALLPMLDDAVSVLSLHGAAIRLARMPDYAGIEAAGSDILLAEGHEIHGPSVDHDPDAVGAMARASIRDGAAIDAARLERARAIVAPLRAEIDAILVQHDALILPTTMTTAPRFADFAEGKPTWTPMRTIPFNLTGHPALSVPMGLAGGLPLGLQLVGRHGEEATLLRIAAAFEAATDHSVAQPAFA